MRIAVTGASGLIGSALSERLRTLSHEVVAVSRSGPSSARRIVWDPQKKELNPAPFAGLDAVIHLAGENVAGYWTASKKKAIHDSRVDGTRLLVQNLHALPESERPKTFLLGSAIGYYGPRGEEELTEQSGRGDGFLAQVCVDWEGPASLAQGDGMRVAHLRTGIVLSKKGGPLGKMLVPFKLCVGGKVGNGQQWMSWISMDDEVGAIIHALENDAVRGPVNLVAPNPVRNAEFTTALGEAIGRPTVVPMPAPAVSVLFGEMGRALLLSSQRVQPQKLLATGYRFQHPTLKEGLQAALA